MSTLKQLLIIVFVGLIIYLIYKPELLKKFPFINYFLKNKETFQINNLETKEEESILLTSPTVTSSEVRQLINMKNTLIKPFTSVGTHPDTNRYRNLTELDFKNLQAYLINIFNNITNNKINYKIIPLEISQKIYCANADNLLYLTPIDIKGNVIINNKPFGTINLVISLRGTTNSIYVPKNGVFINTKKYEMYIESITITKVIKNNALPQKQKGFYATADNIDMMITNKPQNYNKTPQEIKLERKIDNPLTTFTELEDSEEDFNLSEIIREENDDDDEDIINEVINDDFDSDSLNINY